MNAQLQAAEHAARPWLSSYPASVPVTIDPTRYRSLAHLIGDSFSKYAARPAYVFMGREFSYRQIDESSQAFACYLQQLGLEQGDRVAIMMPNVPQ